ncbi:MAG: LacI family DNA-binding transcriptional regulator [Fulvivirga sp.]
MKRANVRIKDIAEKAGISTGTVDRVLHNRGRVSEAVRQRVLKIAKDLNYEPNLLARALVSNRSYHIAALIPDPAVDDYWQAPKEGIEKAGVELKQYGVGITQFIFDPRKVSSFRDMADSISETDFDGILIAPIFYRESLSYFNKWKRHSVPFILFNTQVADYEPLSYIGQDSYQSGYLAAKLMHYGHSRPVSLLIAHIDEDILNSSHLIKKEQGFADYFAQNTPPDAYQIIQADLQDCDDKKICAGQLDKLLADNPGIKGIFVTNSKSNVIADYLNSRQIKDIHLIGYDLMSKNLHFLEQGVIHFLINQNPKGQGYHGIHAFADHLIFNKKVSAIKYLPLDIITKENLHYYIEADL